MPVERITLGCFYYYFYYKHTGVDYAGPVYTKLGHVRKPTIVKVYVCVFISLSVKVVHLELV